MRNFQGKSVFKTITVWFLIITMLCSNIVPIVSWAAEVFDDDGTVIESEYVKFNLTWHNDQTELSMKNGQTTAKFDLQFDTLSNFKDFKIQVDKSDLVEVSFSNTGEYFDSSSSYNQIQYFKDIPGGTKIEGTIKFTFNRPEDFSNYSKDITVKLMGIYEKDGEEFNVEITKNLKANITSQAEVDYHTADMTIKNVKTSVHTSSDTNILYSVDKIYTYYHLDLKGENIENVILDCNFYRTATGNENVYYPTEVELGYGFSTWGFKLTEVEGEDGKPRYVITKGEEQEEFTKNKLFDLDMSGSLIANEKYICVTYDIENPEADAGTTMQAEFEFTSNGYTITTDASGVNPQKTTVTEIDGKTNFITLYRYTPGEHAWGNSYIKEKGYIYQTSLDDFIKNNKLELTYDTYFEYTDEGEVSGDDATVTHGSNTIQYYNLDTTSNIRKTLSDEEMYLKSINVKSIPLEDGWIKFYKTGEAEPFFTATKNNLTYTASEDLKIGTYRAEMSDFLENRYTGWTTTYELDASKMKENGLTENQILNIRNIYKAQTVSGSWLYTGNNEATYNVQGYERQPISHFSIVDTDLNSTRSQTSQPVLGNIVLDFYIKGMSSTDANQLDVVNTNPIIYIELPEQFDFDIRDISFYYNRQTIKLSDYKIKKIDGKNILEIKTEGQIEGTGVNYTEYRSYSKLTINYKRTLKPKVMKTYGYLNVYMKTDEDKYYSYTTDTKDYDEDGNIQDRLAYDSLYYTISDTAKIQLSNAIYSASGEMTANEDVKIESGKTVKYNVTLENTNEAIKNINIVTRLPFEGNKNIIGQELIDLGSNCTFTNLKNIKVYTVSSSGTKTLVNNSSYTIGYSTDETANLDSTYTTSLGEGEVPKTLQIDFVDSYTLYRNSNLMIEFELDIPENTEVGKHAAQTSAVRYTNSSKEIIEQEASKSNVIVESAKGVIEIIKTFEGTECEESLKNIEFKITNMNDKEQFFTTKTDENGHALFENVPVGEWEITEITEFESYYAYPEYVRITNGENYTEEEGKAVEVKNKIKMAKLEIIKTWEDTDEFPGSVSFAIEGKTVGGDKYTTSIYTSVTTDSEGNKVQKGEKYVPYGNYTIKETDTVYGWNAEDTDISVKSETVQVEIENKVARGNVVINKKVPEGDSPEGIKFRLSGTGDLSYINTEGQEVVFNIDETITIDENGYGEFKNIPLGTYLLEEIEIPEITTSEGTVTKYLPIRMMVRISEGGEVVKKEIENKRRTGDLNITVTATEGTDFTLFKVRVSGTSYYGTKIDEEYNVPESGKINIKDLPIGEYKVEECNTKIVNGKILTISPDGYEVTYNPQDVYTKGVKVEESKAAEAKIHNEYIGKGIVKIVKTLEAEEDVSKAKGIQFKIKGRDLVGRDVEEIIEIGEDGTGTSKEIPIGTYLLSEIEETVPETYQIAEEQEITITTENTSENPLVLTIENKLATGNIIMETELKEGGYPTTPVTYSVTKVDGKLNSIGETIDVVGDRNSYAKLTDLEAGRYLVEQKIIPEGYIKDTRQVVNITRDEFGYALFIIEKEVIEEFENTKVVINKQIVNEEGMIATEEDFEKAKIDKKDAYSFEVKIQNVDTKEVYYSFIDEKSSDTIVGLPYGTYEIEEVYKPKYKLLEITGERLTKDEKTGKITFTLSEDNKDIKNKIIINVKNVINTEFGFGGQDSKDNLSKVLKAEVEKLFVTKAKVYIRDDENKKISDAKFKLYDSNGNIVKLVGRDGEYIQSEEGKEEISPINGAIIFKALPVGEYKLENTSINESYLKSDDRKIIVYESAVGVTRIELLRNIPRGSIRLSTVYIDDLGKEHYAPNSKYKILDTENDEVLTFIKKADGTYERSNLPNAKEEITLKSGYIDVNGIEAGHSYQVGLVNVTDTYGIIKEEPETVEIEEGVSKEVKVNVEDRSNMFVDVITYENSNKIVALAKDGKIWAYDTDYTSGYEMTCINDLEDFAAIKNVKFKDLTVIEESWEIDTFIAVDEDGKVWTWGYYEYLGDGATEDRSVPVCISDVEGHVFNNIKIKKIADGISDYGIYVLDENGKVWHWGNPPSQDYSNKWLEKSATPTCVSDISDLKNTKIKDITLGYQQVIAIDENGKVWTWGNNYNCSCGLPYEGENIVYYTKPICISNLEGSNIKNAKIVKAAGSYCVNFLIDSENRLWTFGQTAYGKMGIGDGDVYGNGNSLYWNPICINENNESNPLNEVGIIDIDCKYETVSAIDENGKLWSWGYNGNQGDLGTGGLFKDDYSKYPICISDLENNELNTTKLSVVSVARYSIGAAIDINGNLWIWGSDNRPYPYYGYLYKDVPPIKYSINTKAYFNIPKFTKISTGSYHTVAIDEEGKVWAWGSNSSGILGIGYNKPSTTTPVCVSGNISEISKAKIVDISAGYNCSLALDSEGNLWRWGENSYGQLGTSADMYGIYNMPEARCINKVKSEDNLLYGKKIQKISAQYCHCAVIDTEGKLYTFGYNYYNQLGDPDTSKRTQVCINDLYTDLANVKFADVSVGYDHTMALTEDGDVYTFGRNGNGQLGHSNSDNITPYCVTANTESMSGVKIKQISAGYSHSLAIDEEGKVWVWGCSSDLQLGLSTTTNIYEPICLSDILGNKLYGKKIEKVVAGSEISIFVDEEGKIWTCGDNYNGRVGQDSSDSKLGLGCLNDKVELIAKDISSNVNTSYTMVLDVDGNLWTWGYCTTGATGFEGEMNYPHPVKLQGKTEKLNVLYNKQIEDIADVYLDVNIKEATGKELDTNNVKQTETAYKVTMKLDNEGNLWTYGENNEYGILGIGTVNSQLEPKIINHMFEGKAIEEIVYLYRDLAIVKDVEGYIWIWGDNDHGQLGIGTLNIQQSYTPVKVMKAKEVYVYSDTIIVVDESNKLFAWGQNSYYQCGATGIVTSPKQVGNFEVKKVVNYGQTMIIQDIEDKIWVWGVNTYGQCATGNTTTQKEPVCISDIYGFRVEEILISGLSNSIKDKEGKIWVWGRNQGGLGTGDTNNATTPICISDKYGFTVQKIIKSTIIQDTEGRIWSWGSNSYGIAGVGSTDATISTPTQINAETKFVIEEVFQNDTTVIVRDTNNKIWTWGQNGFGQCGTGNTETVYSPTCISEGTGMENSKIVEFVDRGNDTTYFYGGYAARDEEGKIWTWGRNGCGQCGTNSEEEYCKPKCINSMPGLENVRFTEMTFHYNRSAKDSEGKTWVWGINTAGMLGIGSQENYIRVPVCRDEYFNTIGLKVAEDLNSSNILGSESHYMVVDVNGDIWTWGNNKYGQCGVGNTENVYTPTCISKDKGFKYKKMISSKGYTTVLIQDTEGNIWTWGKNLNGMCGTGNTEYVLEPICINKDKGFKVEKVLESYGRIILQDTEGRIWAWGKNDYGQCGIGNSENVLEPTCIIEKLTLSENDKIATVRNYTCILTENGEAWIWGGAELLTPIKLNDLEKIGGAKIKQIGIDTSNNKYALTEEGKVYKISEGVDKVESPNEGEIAGTYLEEGPWRYKFKIVTNNKYSE